MLSRCLITAFLVLVACSAREQIGSRAPASFEVMTRRFDVDVDGAPNAYGPPGKPALDTLDHAMDPSGRHIVGYLTDSHGRPILQGPRDPFPGYYISQTAFQDPANENDLDPRAYVDATRINYVVLGDEAKRRGARMGDFVAVYSARTRRSVFGIVADNGNPSGDEGSLHLLQALGYPFHDGKNDAVEHGEIVVRFYPRSNASQQFFFTQAALDAAAAKLGLSRDFKTDTRQ